MILDKAGIPIIGGADYWKNRTVDQLRQAFDKVKVAREFMLHRNKTLDEETEALFQLAGNALMNLAKGLHPAPKVPEPVKKEIKNAKK